MDTITSSQLQYATSKQELIRIRLNDPRLRENLDMSLSMSAMRQAKTEDVPDEERGARRRAILEEKIATSIAAMTRLAETNLSGLTKQEASAWIEEAKKH